MSFHQEWGDLPKDVEDETLPVAPFGPHLLQPWVEFCRRCFDPKTQSSALSSLHWMSRQTRSARSTPFSLAASQWVFDGFVDRGSGIQGRRQNRHRWMRLLTGSLPRDRMHWRSRRDWPFLSPRKQDLRAFPGSLRSGHPVPPSLRGMVTTATSQCQGDGPHFLLLSSV